MLLYRYEGYVYNQYGTLVASSSTIHSNFEIVQFVPTVSGTYTIQIQDSGGRTGSDYIGIAMWSGFWELKEQENGKGDGICAEKISNVIPGIADINCLLFLQRGKRE